MTHLCLNIIFTGTCKLNSNTLPQGFLVVLSLSIASSWNSHSVLIFGLLINQKQALDRLAILIYKEAVRLATPENT